MRKPIIAANWKMNKGPSETEDFLNNFLSTIGKATDKCDVVVAPPFVSIPAAAKLLASHDVSIAAQNVSQYDSGAYTGEVSVMMLKELYVPYVILGHSERRALYGESDEIVNAKIKKAREANLKAIFCIGETLEEREGGQLDEVLGRQIREGLKGLKEKDVLETVVAYEPVWAIGTGKTASPEQAQEAHAKVRVFLAENFGGDVADRVRIQYGGSVKPANAAELLSQPDIDGALVGGASLEASSFLQIIQNGTQGATAE
jgi:triosephosphate isomerase